MGGGGLGRASTINWFTRGVSVPVPEGSRSSRNWTYRPDVTLERSWPGEKRIQLSSSASGVASDRAVSPENDHWYRINSAMRYDQTTDELPSVVARLVTVPSVEPGNLRSKMRLMAVPLEAKSETYRSR